MLKLFAALMLKRSNYFDGLTKKLFSDLYLAKFLLFLDRSSAKLFVHVCY